MWGSHPVSEWEHEAGINAIRSMRTMEPPFRYHCGKPMKIDGKVWRCDCGSVRFGVKQNA